MKKTKQWTLATDKKANDEIIEEAAAMINAGELVAFPTETVYGLGADALSDEAVERIFQAKGRPQDNPLIAHVATQEQLLSLVTSVPPFVEQLIYHFSPGPITYVLPSNGTCASRVTAGLSTVAIRIPDHPVALALIKASGRPIAAPSANTSGKPSPTEASHVIEDLSGKIAGILDGGQTGIGMESTVVDCTSNVPIILRPGGVTADEIRKVVGEVKIANAQSTEEKKPLSPGVKYRHYSPDVPLTLMRPSVTHMQQYIDDAQANGKIVGVLASDALSRQLIARKTFALGSDLSQIAKNIYRGLRSFSHEEVDEIICETFPKEGIGIAIMNRLERAAEKNSTNNK
ncbi:MAG TPA: L-threonylcarbamoyladenylate synthase [Bacillota bacterium]|nr:L-threonylcarbamoyladenylate synthase [Bacillota bacterium]